MIRRTTTEEFAVVHKDALWFALKTLETKIKK